MNDVPTAATPDAATSSAPYAGPHRIVIVGGGAAGLELATRLGNTLGKSGRAHITLVERARTHLWKPLLHAVAAGSLDRAQHELHYLAQAHWHHFTYRFGAMDGLDRGAKRIHMAETHDDEGRMITPAATLAYDTLVLSVGSVTNDFGTPGAAQFAVPLETPDQASRFHRRLVNACLRANAQDGPVRPGQLHVAIIGAGATGTELSAELHRTARAVVAYGLDRIDPERDIRIILVEAATRILPALPERISVATQELLASMGVAVRAGTRVSAVRDDGVEFADGSFLPSELVVWSAGVKGPDFLRDLGLAVNRGNQVIVDQTLRTEDPDIFAMGDCAECPRPGFDQPVPPRAQAAHQQASHLARTLTDRLAGKPARPYVYRDFGSLVSLGRYSTVGSLMGFLVGKSMFIEGYFARLMYRSLYKMHLAALHGRGSMLWRTLQGLFSPRPETQVKLH
jgi:NADH dehydrogenase